MGRKNSAEHNLKISETRKALKIDPWNKGLKMRPDTIDKMKAWRAKNAEEMRARLMGHPSSLKGKKISVEHRRKIKENAARPWLGKHLSEEHKKKLSEKRKGFKAGPFSPEHKKKISDAHKALWKNEDFCQMKYRTNNVKPTKPELEVLSILNDLYPGQWRYTGDFSFIINGKCPDFINVNGQKKIIELFGDYWHRGEREEDRAAIFTPFGYETLVIWERELNNINSVISKITEFAKARK